MATIANLTKKDDGFSGTLILPSLNGMRITFEPVKNPTEKGPDYRVTQRRRGVAWLQAVSTCSASPPRSASWAFPASAIDPVKCSRTGMPVPIDWSPQPKRIRLA